MSNTRQGSSADGAFGAAELRKLQRLPRKRLARIERQALATGLLSA